VIHRIFVVLILCALCRPDVVAARAPLIAERSTVVSTNRTKIFVSERTTHRIVILSSDGKPIGSIARNSSDTVTTDREGNLYAAPEYGNRVEIYAPPYARVSKILSFGTQSVRFVATDQKSDIFAVVTVYNGGGPGPPMIYFFKHGATSPCNVLKQQPGIPVYYAYGAFDSQGTLFLSAGNDSGETTVASVPGECSATKATNNVFSQPLDPYGIVTIDANNDVVIQDFSVSSWPIYTFRHPINHVFGAPISTTTLATEHGYAPQALAMGNDGHSIWGAFAGRFAGLNAYAYPAGGKPIQRIGGLQYIWSVATYPAFIPK